jgi:Outer membrane protein (OmpH-like).
MKKILFLAICLGSVQAVLAQTPQAAPVDTLTEQEAATVAALLAKNADEQAPKAKSENNDKIVLPEETKKEALSASAQEPSGKTTQQTVAEESEEEKEEPTEKGTCLTVAFVDIDVAFNEHPRTIAVKEQIREKILAKESEVARAKEEIEMRTRENERLAALVRGLKPFYERIVVEPHPLLPKIEETADTLEMSNLLNHLTFAQAEQPTASPLNTPAQLEDITARMTENKKVIEERSFFIDNYKYTTREEILKLEKTEVNEILQDIYREIKSFAKKRNIGALVRKDEILYGEKPVNVTQDFVNRLKKSKKYRKRGK